MREDGEFCGAAQRQMYSFLSVSPQSQYKSHFVAASLNNQKTGSSAAGASGWTSAGSLNSVPTSSAQQNAANPDSPIAATAAAKGVPGFTSTGTLSSVPTFPSVGVQGFNNTNASANNREGSGGSTGVAGGGSGSGGGGGGGGSGGIVRERYNDNRNSRHTELPRRGEGGGRYNDVQRHGEGGGRHSDAYRHGEGRHGDSHRHGESRHFTEVGSGNRNNGESRNSTEGRNESRNGENRKDVNSRDTKTDGFAVPEPPKRKKSRWDS